MPLHPGDQAPDFALIDQNGTVVRLSGLRGQPVVVFFYPRDHSPLCSQESCYFRDEYQRFQQAEAKVLGISADDSRTHANFAQKLALPYQLLSDSNREVARAFGVPQRYGLLPARVTFTIDPEGIIQHITHADLSVARHVDEAMLALQRLK
ncbi:MAG: peroxiredoxin [Myxococcales bacterium]|nr:peroxiredoxin [Myxococcales bacterium]